MKPSFNKLWLAYPKENRPCEEGWPNQCSIRMSIALNDEGSIPVNEETYPEPKCKHDHARGAESLANWLWLKHLQRPIIYDNTATAKAKLQSKQGIIFFKDCFIRPNETERRGDHIDLWRTGETKTWDDPENKAKQVWFWELV
jgi:hypothetical protein